MDVNVLYRIVSKSLWIHMENTDGCSSFTTVHTLHEGLWAIPVPRVSAQISRKQSCFSSMLKIWTQLQHQLPRAAFPYPTEVLTPSPYRQPCLGSNLEHPSLSWSSWDSDLGGAARHLCDSGGDP